MTEPGSPIEDVYSRRSAQFGSEATSLERRLRRMANMRLAIGLGVAGSIFWIISPRSVIASVSAVALGVSFTLLVVRYRRVSYERGRAEIMRDLNAEGIHRARRDWTRLPERQVAFPPDGHPYANDLDLFGHASLFHLLDTSGTTPGRDRLREWLLHPAAREEVASRQHAVTELATNVDWLQELQFRGRRGETDSGQTGEVFDWALDSSEPHRTSISTYIARSTLVVIIAIAVLSLGGILDPAILILPILVNIAVSFIGRDRIGDRIETARRQIDAIR